MSADTRRLARLQRLEKIRAIAKHEAALEAARAEGTLAQLEALAERTRNMAEEYRQREGMNDGLELRQLGQFVAGLTGICNTTLNDASQARVQADVRQQALAQAERRRAAVEERAKIEQRAIELRRQPLSQGSRRQLGTPLE